MSLTAEAPADGTHFEFALPGLGPCTLYDHPGGPALRRYGGQASQRGLDRRLGGGHDVHGHQGLSTLTRVRRGETETDMRIRDETRT